MLDYLLPVIFSLCLIGLIIALIFKKDFRKDVLTTEGEAKILGILSIKGVAILILTGLFIGGLIWSITNLKKDIPKDIAIALSNNLNSDLSIIDIKAKTKEREFLDFFKTEYIPEFSKNILILLPPEMNLKENFKEILDKFGKASLETYITFISGLNLQKDKSYSKIYKYYGEINTAIGKNEKDRYESLILNRPDFALNFDSFDVKKPITIAEKITAITQAVDSLPK